MRPYVAFDPDERLDLRVEPVAHELELAVRRNEGDGAVVLEARQPHALVELDVLHLYRLAPGRPSRRLEHGLVIEAEPQLGHAAQVAFQLDGAEDLAAEDVAGGADEEVEGFDDVEEDFIFPVSYPFAAPADGVGDGDGRPSLNFELVGFLGDVLLQYL